MNFINPLLAGLQLLKFNFTTSDGRLNQTHFQHRPESSVEIPKEQQIVKTEDLYKLQAITQQEIINRQFLENYILRQQQLNLALLCKNQDAQDNQQIVVCQDVKQEELLYEEKSNKKKIQESKKIKKMNVCGHPEKEHYAKGMCNNCYHRVGRNKAPWLCNHSKLYACGLCQNCYINKYNLKRRLDGNSDISEIKQ